MRSLPSLPMQTRIRSKFRAKSVPRNACLFPNNELMVIIGTLWFLGQHIHSKLHSFFWNCRYGLFGIERVCSCWQCSCGNCQLFCALECSCGNSIFAKAAEIAWETGKRFFLWSDSRRFRKVGGPGRAASVSICPRARRFGRIAQSLVRSNEPEISGVHLRSCVQVIGRKEH